MCVLQKKRLSVKIEKGTAGINDVDISWIPQETLNAMSKFILPSCYDYTAPLTLCFVLFSYCDFDF